MNSKSKRIFLYLLLALMVITQVAFAGTEKDDTSDESVKGNTENISAPAEDETEETKADGTTADVKTAAALAASAGGVSPVVIVEENRQVSEERLLGEMTDTEVSEYQDMIVCYADPYLPVRTEASRDSKTVGKLYPGSYADVLERGEEWSKIKSGNVVGYIQNMYVCFDNEAEDLAGQLRGTLSTALTLEEEKKQQEQLAKQQAAAAAAAATTVSASSYEVCLLAAIIDWEAGAEPYDGKLAVGYVVVNRVNCGYAGSIQGVISARGQFSGVTDGNGNWSDKFQTRINRYLNGTNNDCMRAAQDVLVGANNPLNATYLNFNTVLASCSQWQQIGNHFFYNR